MNIAEGSWFSEIYKTITQQNITENEWKNFLSSDDVSRVLANEQDEYRRLYLQKLLASSFAQDPIVQEITRTSIPSQSGETLALVNDFFQSQTVLSLPANTPKEKLYNLYLEFLFEKLLASSSLGTKLLALAKPYFGTISSDQFAQIIHAFVSSDSFQAYIQQYGLRSIVDDINAGRLTQLDPDLTQLFIAFATTYVKQVHGVESVMALSSNAMEQRKIIYTVFELLAQMISTISVAQIRCGKAAKFITDKRSAYAAGLSRATFLQGTGDFNTSTLASSTDSVNTPINEDLTDAKKFTLGFSGVSVNDISEWLYDQYKEVISTPSRLNAGEQPSFSLYANGQSGSATSRNHITVQITPDAGSPEHAVLTASYIRASSIIPSQPILFQNVDEGRVPLELTEILSSVMDHSGLPNNISPGQVFDWVQAIYNNPSSETFTYHLAGTTDQKLTLQLTRFYPTIIATYSYEASDTPITQSRSIDDASNADATTAALNDLFKNVWTQAKSSSYINLSDATTVPKIPIGVGLQANAVGTNLSGGDLAKLNAAVSKRQTENQFLSTQLTALTARMDLLDSLTEQQSQVEDVSATGLKMLNSTIRMAMSTLSQVLITLFT